MPARQLLNVRNLLMVVSSRWRHNPNPLYWSTVWDLDETMATIDKERADIQRPLNILRSSNEAFSKLEDSLRHVDLYLPGPSSSSSAWVEALLASLNTARHRPPNLEWSQVLRDVDTIAAFFAFTTKFLTIREAYTQSIEVYSSSYPIFRQVGASDRE